MNGIVIVVMICGAFVAATLAAAKNRNVVGWAVLGALLPLIAAIIVGSLPAEPAPGDRSA